MKSPARCRIYLGVGVALAALGVNWLANSESSPLYHYFLYHVLLPNLWAAINAISVIIALVLDALYVPDRLSSQLGIFVQWFLLGLLLSIPLCRGGGSPE